MTEVFFSSFSVSLCSFFSHVTQYKSLSFRFVFIILLKKGKTDRRQFIKLDMNSNKQESVVIGIRFYKYFMMA